MAALAELFDALHARGYTVAGPIARDRATMLAELPFAVELPYGWGIETEAGRYRLRAYGD
ncbi:hypothetical protein AB0F81_45245 [Actinoplanes sp. NPDC024001]|uniref:hypothetical protein n=1 Tax=Actinoplanes sp. NPDC024001 TaxID=3154598 RepID=UPI0033D0C5E6